MTCHLHLTSVCAHGVGIRLILSEGGWCGFVHACLRACAWVVMHNRSRLFGRAGLGTLESDASAMQHPLLLAVVVVMMVTVVGDDGGDGDGDTANIYY